MSKKKNKKSSGGKKKNGASEARTAAGGDDTSAKRVEIDPSNLSDVLFRDGDGGDGDGRRFAPYVHPNLVVVATTAAAARNGGGDGGGEEPSSRGRGLFAKSDIKSGTCLFATYPAVQVDKVRLRNEFLRRKRDGGDDKQRLRLEDLAEDMLVREMRNCITRKDAGMVNSFAVLEGGGAVDGAAVPSVDRLLGLDRGGSVTEDGISEMDGVTDDDLRQIVRRNAFGPDFCTYEKIESYWTRTQEDTAQRKDRGTGGNDGADVDDDPDAFFVPPHVLGLYPLAAMLNHSCIANTVRVYRGNRNYYKNDGCGDGAETTSSSASTGRSNGDVDSENSNDYGDDDLMIAHACCDIPAGAELVWSYVPPTSSFDRRGYLQQHHGFVCRCDRCAAEHGDGTSGSSIPPVPDAIKRWNERVVDNVRALADEDRDSIVAAFRAFEDDVLNSTSAPLSNERKRYLRVGYTNLHINYFNATLAESHGNTKSGDGADDAAAKKRSEDVLSAAMQLHFSFCACHNASTEHLSVLHLCYELIRDIHRRTLPEDQQTRTLPKLRFWTEQVKLGHMTRYGNLGMDVESVRRVMVHTRGILRQKDGILAARYPFI